MKSGVCIIVLLGFAVSAITSCTTGPQSIGQVHGIMAAAQLGVTTDENFQVVDIRPNGAAATAGVQIGDLLLDLSWIPSDAPMYLPEGSDILYVAPDGFLVDALGNPLTDSTGRRLTADDIIMQEPGTLESATETKDVPPIRSPMPSDNSGYTRSLGPPVADYADFIEKDTLSFTPKNTVRLKSLASYSVPLKLRLKRGEKTVELTITPMYPRHLSSELDSSGRPISSPTPIALGHYKF